MLLDTAVRGVAAVYLGADIYGPQGPTRRIDLVKSVSMNLGTCWTTRTRTVVVTATQMANAMLPASMRQNQTVPATWQMAVYDAQSRGEPAITPPVPILLYPFGAQCRACLRAASTDPRRSRYRPAACRRPWLARSQDKTKRPAVAGGAGLSGDQSQARRDHSRLKLLPSSVSTRLAKSGAAKAGSSSSTDQ
jgi:hypothetical protein